MYVCEYGNRLHALSRSSSCMWVQQPQWTLAESVGTCWSTSGSLMVCTYGESADHWTQRIENTIQANF